MVRFMDRLDERMEVLDKRIQDKAVKAGEDYLSFFESHAEEAYKEYYLYKCFRDLKKKARESGSPEKVLEYLRKSQNVCLDTLLRQDIAALLYFHHFTGAVQKHFNFPSLSVQFNIFHTSVA